MMPKGALVPSDAGGAQVGSASQLFWQEAHTNTPFAGRQMAYGNDPLAR